MKGLTIMRSPIEVAGALPMAAALIVLAGCSGPTAALDGPLIVSEGDGGDVSATALLQGPLAKVGDCLGVGTALAIWPQGVSWREDEQKLVLADGTDVPLGADVHGGGGSYGLDAVTDMLGQDAAEAVTSCGAGGEETFVFNIGGEVDRGLL